MDNKFKCKVCDNKDFIYVNYIEKGVKIRIRKCELCGNIEKANRKEKKNSKSL